MRQPLIHCGALIVLLAACLPLVLLLRETSTGPAARCVQADTRALPAMRSARFHSREAPREVEAEKKSGTIKIITRWIKQGAKSLRSGRHMTKTP